MLSFSSSADDYLCFSDPIIASEKLCYPSTESSQKDLVAVQAIELLARNLSNPRRLVKMSNDMKEHYSPEMFIKSLNKHFIGLSKGNITHTLTFGDNTAIFLKDYGTLLFNHIDQAFVFSYKSPIELEGAISYFSSGFKPESRKLPTNNSNCNLGRDGVVFISPSKQDFFYSSKKSFCEYRGRFFRGSDKKVRVAMTSQIGQGYTILDGDFHKFLIWLKENP